MIRNRLSFPAYSLCALIGISTSPVEAQTVDELQRQLQAQQEINAQLRGRIDILEAQLEEWQRTEDPEAGDNEQPSISNDNAIGFTPPPDEEFDESDLDALEQALVQQGSSVLPPGTRQIVPSASWRHSGSSALFSESNSYVAGLSGRMGLPAGFMLGASVPYVLHRESSNGENAGIGDVSISLWKQLLARTRTQPSIVAQLNYAIPTGEDPFETVQPLGSGFHRLSGSVSVAKAFAPVVFYGGASYGHAFSRTVGENKLQPGEVFGLDFGSTLAATPDITLSLGMSFDFVGKNETNGMAIVGTDRTFGTLDVGAGMILSRYTYLSIAGKIGITDDTPDFAIGIALPTRF